MRKDGSGDADADAQRGSGDVDAWDGMPMLMVLEPTYFTLKKQKGATHPDEGKLVTFHDYPFNAYVNFDFNMESASMLQKCMAAPRLMDECIEMEQLEGEKKRQCAELLGDAERTALHKAREREMEEQNKAQTAALQHAESMKDASDHKLYAKRGKEWLKYNVQKLTDRAHREMYKRTLKKLGTAVLGITLALGVTALVVFGGGPIVMALAGVLEVTGVFQMMLLTASVNMGLKTGGIRIWIYTEPGPLV